jgi:hypothetical protein
MNKLQNHIFICSTLIYFHKGKRMLKFELLKQFHAKHNKVKLFKVLKFGG